MKLATWRKSLKLSQSGAARLIGVSQQQINRWERPKASISLKYALLIAKKTGGLVDVKDWR